MRIFLLIITLLISTVTFAVCPLCTFVVGAGIGLSQYCGIDDTIIGVWIGGLIISAAIFTRGWLQKKNLHFYGDGSIIALVYYVVTLLPLYLNNILGHSLNKLWGVDKLLLGIAIGSIIFLSGAISYEWLKKHHNNHAYFPFQKVVMPVAPLMILSVFFYIITK